jgi:hypothetical protein
MGAGATDQCLEGHPYPVQLYPVGTRYVPIIYIINVPAMRHTIPYSIIPGYRTVPV